MRQRVSIQHYSLLASFLVLTAGIGAVVQKAIAQSSQACEPPAAGEYLLMVVHQTPEIQGRLQETLPRNATTAVCNYLGTEVTRVGGFTDITIANAWAQYLSDISGVEAFVARPAETAAVPTPAATAPDESTPVAEPPQGTTVTVPPLAEAPQAEASPTAPASESFPTPSQAAADLVQPFPIPSEASPQPAPTPTLQATPEPAPAIAAQPVQGAVSYNPRPLGAGYAVLVDYANRPQVATSVRQVTNSQVGLVAYEQRPYLLASYTSDPAVAATVLRNLSDRNFAAVIVDSRKAILLTPAVASD